MSRPNRRAFIYDRANVRSGRILELGALDSPTFPERNVRYLDWFSRDELLAVLQDNERRLPDRIVEPDFVVKEKLFACRVADRFDLAIANHVIEHVADPITWLQQIRALVPSGNLFLAVPDRRFTFDYLRPESSLADLMRAWAEDLDRPSRWQVLDSLYYYRPLRSSDAWNGNLAALQRSRFTAVEAAMRSLVAEREYADAHCYVFSAPTFQPLLNSLSGFSGWHCVEVSDVLPDSNEFYAHFKPTGVAASALPRSVSQVTSAPTGSGTGMSHSAGTTPADEAAAAEGPRRANPDSAPSS